MKDYIDIGKFEINHLTTEEMISDIVTKPLQGNLF